MPKLKKKSSPIVPVFSAQDIFALGREYAELSEQIKVLEARKKELSEKIKSGAEQFGVKNDKGSHYLENDEFILGRIAKKSFRIDQDKAVPILEKMGLGDVVDVVTVKSVNEDKLNSAVGEGRISLNEVENFTSVSVSYSVDVKRKESVTAEVEQSTLKSAARKK